MIFGLPKERPILDHHAKAHIHEIQQNSYGFHEIWWILYGFQVKSIRFHMDFMKSGGFQVKSGGFRTDFTHEIRRISKGQLPGMVSPMFSMIDYGAVSAKETTSRVD